MVFPFKLYINPVKEPEFDNLLKRVQKDRISDIIDRKNAIKIGCRLKPIRNSIIIGTDRKNNKTFIAIPNDIKMERIKNYIIFKKKIL